MPLLIMVKLTESDDLWHEGYLCMNLNFSGKNERHVESQDFVAIYRDKPK